MSCFVGELISEQCHKQDYKAVPNEILMVSDLPLEEQNLLKMRLKNEINSICHYHKIKYLEKYNHIFGRKCCDPMKIHKKPIKNGLRKILLDHLGKKKNVEVDLIPGKALCPTCFSKIFVIEPDCAEIEMENDTDFTPEAYEAVNESPLGKIISICSALDVSPLSKVAKLNKEQRHSALKKKTDQITTAVKRKLEDSFHEDLAEEDLPSNSKECEYDILIQKLKEKCSLANNEEKIQIISLLPSSWTRSKIMKEFGVSEYIVKLTKELVKEQGILPHLSKKKFQKIGDEVIKKVIEFYEDDLNSRLCPGKKDCVSVKVDNDVKIQKQKRLILLPLNELFTLFKQTYPNVKIGRSMFCVLRPKWCVLPGSSGTHSVCVCKYHQNVKLIIEGAKLNVSYRDLIEYLVCDMSKDSCMLDKCSECPGSEGLCQVLENEIDKLPEEVVFKEWVHTDRADLITRLLPKDEFLNHLVEELEKLKSHHYISKTQSDYFKRLKGNLEGNECLVIGDFAENFTFCVQDEIQSFHWTNRQATLHPFVFYFKKEEAICCKSICIISDHLIHDTSTVYEFQKHLIKEVKKALPNVKKIIYFSDGASSQYKNKKNFINMCQHENDFGLIAEWNFFATSHGKNSCDGIGGTTKREVTRASMLRPYNDQILTPEDMYKYCTQKITGITYIFVSAEEIKRTEEKLTKRFELCLPVKGTRGYHRFTPVSDNEIRCYTTSTSEEFDEHKTSIVYTNLTSFTNNDYVACIYEDQWWLGIVKDKSIEENDLLVHFFNPAGPRTAFQLSKKDIVWVPVNKVVRKITPTELTTASGRTHNISEKLCNEISTLYNQIMNFHTKA